MASKLVFYCGNGEGQDWLDKLDKLDRLVKLDKLEKLEKYKRPRIGMVFYKKFVIKIILLEPFLG